MVRRGKSEGKMVPGLWVGNWIDGAAILSEGTKGRERFREMIRFGEMSFGPIGVKVLMGDQSRYIFKLQDVDSTKEQGQKYSSRPVSLQMGFIARIR